MLVGLRLAGVIAAWLLPLVAATGQGLPTVPDSLMVPAGERLILEGHATGVQIYTCRASGDSKPAWALKAPEAELRDSKGGVIIRHFAGPTWQHNDGSAVIGKAVARADAPDGTSVPWLLLTATSHSGSGALAKVTSVQRLHTHGGQAPEGGCDPGKLDAEVRVPYTADYYFYTASR
jgi:hypothetical protein